MSISTAPARRFVPVGGRAVSCLMGWAVMLAMTFATAGPIAADVVSIGHRGNSLFAPENTVAAIESAYGIAYGVEIDVRESSDGHLVLMHDSTVDRTTDGTGAVSGMTLAQLRALDAGSWFHPQFAGEPVPTLDQAITAAMAGGLLSCVERKTGPASAYVTALQPVRESVEIHSFDWNFLSAVDALDDQFELVAIGSGLLSTQWANIPSAVSKISWRSSDLTASDVQTVHDAGKQLYAWTVNDSDEIQSQIGLGVDGIISDNPGLVTRILQGGRPSLADGLMGRWGLDDGLGDPNATIAQDSIGGNDATLGGFDTPPSWLADPDAKLGGALSFDGIDDHALIPHSPGMDTHSNAVTVSAWVKIDTLPTMMLDAFGGIFDSEGDSYVLYLDRGNAELRFKVTDSSGTAARPGIPESMLDTTDWHHVAGVYDGGAGVARIYFDGQLIDMHAQDGSGSDGLVDEVKTGQVAALGRNGAGAAYHFPGDIDEVAVWDRALSEAEVQFAYNAGVGRPTGACDPVIPSVHPEVYLPLDDDLANRGTGGNAYDGTLMDGFDGTNAFVGGQVDQALDLDNPDNTFIDGDYVSIPYTLPDHGTIAMWYYVEDYYNYQSIFDNSLQQDDWEMWVYDDGRARFRIEGDSVVTYDLDNLDGPGNWYHLAMTWSKSETATTPVVAMNLYVDGLLRDVDEGAWIDPGDTFFLGGGHELNEYGNGIWDELLIYDTVLNSDEILALSELSPIPELGVLAWDGLGDGNWGDHQDGTCYSRWVNSVGHPLTSDPDASTNAVIMADTVTVVENRQSKSLTVQSGVLAIADGVTLDIEDYVDFAPDTTLTLGDAAQLNTGSQDSTIHAIVGGNDSRIEGTVFITGEISLAEGDDTLTIHGWVEMDGGEVAKGAGESIRDTLAGYHATTAGDGVPGTEGDCSQVFFPLGAEIAGTLRVEAGGTLDAIKDNVLTIMQGPADEENFLFGEFGDSNHPGASIPVSYGAQTPVPATPGNYPLPNQGTYLGHGQWFGNAGDGDWVGGVWTPLDDGVYYTGGVSWIEDSRDRVEIGVFQAKPGDCNGDRSISFADFNDLANNYTGALDPDVGGKEWRQGDFNGDADVDFGDFNDLANNYTGAGVEYGPQAGGRGSLPAPGVARADEPPMAPNGQGEASLIVYLANTTDADGVSHAAGDVVLSVDAGESSTRINGYEVYSEGGLLIPDADGVPYPLVGGAYMEESAAAIVAFGGLTSPLRVSVDADWTLGWKYDVQGKAAGDLEFSYGTAAGVISGNVLYVVPEPGSLLLLACGALGLLLWRRQRRTA